MPRALHPPAPRNVGQCAPDLRQTFSLAHSDHLGCDVFIRRFHLQVIVIGCLWKSLRRSPAPHKSLSPILRIDVTDFGRGMTGLMQGHLQKGIPCKDSSRRLQVCVNGSARFPRLEYQRETILRVASVSRPGIAVDGRSMHRAKTPSVKQYIYARLDNN